MVFLGGPEACVRLDLHRAAGAQGSHRGGRHLALLLVVRVDAAAVPAAAVVEGYQAKQSSIK